MAAHETPASGRELKFRALMAELRRGILDGTWPPGSKLPTERALATETGLSVTTVRRAYEDLVALGLVERRQGAGTFSAHRPERDRADRRIVGVLVPDTTFYYPRVLQGIEKELAAAGARLVLACSHYDPDEEDAAVERLLSAGVHGLLLVPSLHTATDPGRRAEELLALPVPAVLVERRLAAHGPGDPTEHVCTDHEGGAYDAVRHLRALGHERLGLVARTDAPTTAPIESGFARALDDLGLPAAPAYERDVMARWDTDRADRALAALRAAGVTGALCFGDREAALMLGAARRAGVRVPEDLALISYDNEFADVAETPLTAVSPPKYQLGRLAAQILLRRLAEGDAAPLHQVQLRPRLVVRASCGGRARGAV
ncbi:MULTISPECIES: GntR family transcriptional regulator [Streptomyces]|uniref:DNA-binding LacI/PurR family transcriptional regulator n=1 Tax=Streptomyces nymphaeiformis TaxID=2663842 RepID=A0A7W7TW05_9ACTN|nr:substrate-binding domain-containing protein [Streptomyces nymphaeiformis]MBB4980376.1 DNA-binding LacI/PurR family transcriptional regulator [Streptomyces nymphaeiformis]